MTASTKRILPLVLLAFAACDPDCGTGLTELYPNLTLTPEVVEVIAPVAADTEVAVTILNDANVPLKVIKVELLENSDPAFVLVDWPEEVKARERRSVTLRVRPLVVGKIEARVRVTAEDEALPEPVREATIIVDARDLGLPDVEVTPLEISFTEVGLSSAAQKIVAIKNVGVRDLIIDETVFENDDVDDASLRLVTPIMPGWAVAPNESITVNVAFAPTDTATKSGRLKIRTNDPDEPEVFVEVDGQGVTCPIAVAELLDDGFEIKPLDTIRLDGAASYVETPGTEIASYEWAIEQRPVGSTTAPKTPDAARTDLTLDLAGKYVLRLRVTDTRGVSSCNDALVEVDAKPDADLHVQLVWDHPSADLDVHFLREGGLPFTHEGDVYFSNRTPEWSAIPEQNPTLDLDDDEGYGPENVNLRKPAPGSKWRILVHYWNKQTDGDPFTVASVRIFAKGQQVADLSNSFEEDQTMWSAIEISWPEDELQLPTLTQIGLTEEFPRPF